MMAYAPPSNSIEDVKSKDHQKDSKHMDKAILLANQLCLDLERPKR